MTGWVRTLSSFPAVIRRSFPGRLLLLMSSFGWPAINVWPPIDSGLLTIRPNAGMTRQVSLTASNRTCEESRDTPGRVNAQPYFFLDSRQPRSNGSRQALGAISW